MFQQGVMDLGSQLCLPKNPKCIACPVNKNCLTNIKGKYPVLTKKKIKRKVKSTSRTMTYFAMALRVY